MAGAAEKTVDGVTDGGYARKQEKRGFFINMTTVLPTFGPVWDSPQRPFRCEQGDFSAPKGPKTPKIARPLHNPGSGRYGNLE